ncbi:MAG TPA: PRC-barrel domain-containing protein, partial [Anaerolineales bacterium]|nr:PRC-barrel domain-containing protein [Anaerolineales bacterium]
FLPSNPQMARVVFWPYVIPETAFTIEHQRLPDGEIAVRRGTSVRASDGPIGRVDELMIEPEDGRITHLVLREGHLRGQKDIAIPVSQIEKLDQDTVYLRLSKQEVKALPEIQIRRSKNSRS